MTTSEVLTIIGGTKDVILGMAGGTIAYLFDYSKAKREGDETFVFLVSSMIINMMLGAFVAYMFGSSLPSDMEYRDAIIGLSGLTAYNIILLAESKFASWIIEKITNKG